MKNLYKLLIGAKREKGSFSPEVPSARPARPAASVSFPSLLFPVPPDAAAPALP